MDGTRHGDRHGRPASHRRSGLKDRAISRDNVASKVTDGPNRLPGGEEFPVNRLQRTRLDQRAHVTQAGTRGSCDLAGRKDIRRCAECERHRGRGPGNPLAQKPFR
jgi:hypothetical protein